MQLILSFIFSSTICNRQRCQAIQSQDAAIQMFARSHSVRMVNVTLTQTQIFRCANANRALWENNVKKKHNGLNLEVLQAG
jgi:hypothetical protein